MKLKYFMFGSLSTLALVAVVGGIHFFLRPPIPENTSVLPPLDIQQETNVSPEASNPEVTTDEMLVVPEASGSLPESFYYEDYELEDINFGTTVKVELSANTREISANAIPNHATGSFPNSANPNTISEQNVSYSIPLNPTFVGDATFAREPGVAVNGVKFEPQTAERAICESGETYSVEAIQDILDLGLDFNNAHVQPSGAYHYHGVSQNLVDFSDTEEDLVHVGFAHDGYLMFYSKSGQFQPSYKLSTTSREGTECDITTGPQSNSIEIEGTLPDGSFVSDWEFSPDFGDLDECNGIEIGGEYVYLVTDEFPYIPRCLNGEFEDVAPTGGPPTGGQGRPAGPPPGR